MFNLIALVSLAAFLIWQFTLRVVIARRMTRVPVRREFRELEPGSSSIPEAAREFFAGVAAEIAPHGYESTPTVMDEAFPRVRAFLNLWRSAAEQTDMMAVYIFSDIGRGWQPASSYVEFNTDLADGGSVNTNNSTELLPWPSGRGVRRFIFPIVRSAGRLRRLHLEAVAARGERILPNIEKSGAALVSAAIEKSYRRLLERGIWRVNAAGDCYEATWKAALYSALYLMWPTLNLRRWLVAVREARMLRRAGMSR